MSLTLEDLGRASHSFLTNALGNCGAKCFILQRKTLQDEALADRCGLRKNFHEPRIHGKVLFENGAQFTQCHHFRLVQLRY